MKPHRRPGTLPREEYLARAREFAKRGWDLPQAKLPPLAVMAIREAVRTREAKLAEIREKYSNEALARAWSVHPNTIIKVASYASWRHLP